MGYQATYDNLELIDIYGALRAAKSISLDERAIQRNDCIRYVDTPNGFLVVSAQQHADESNKQALEIVRNSIVTFFAKKTHANPMIAIKEAILFANKKLYLDATHNQNLLGQQINCMVVLVREKQIFYAYVGDNNLFVKRKGKFKRITPGVSLSVKDEMDETERVNSSAFDFDLQISICDKPLNPDTDDLLFICSDEYIRRSDDFIFETFEKHNKLEEKAIDLLDYAKDKPLDICTSFLIVRFKLLGGKYTEAGSVGYIYGNLLDKIVEFITSNLVLVVMFVVVLLILLIYVM